MAETELKLKDELKVTAKATADKEAIEHNLATVKTEEQ
jgi:hypothetical protein